MQKLWVSIFLNTLELLDGERLIKLATFMNSNRLRYSNTLNLLISKNDQINQVISEKISVGDTLFKKIKEIIRREVNIIF